MINQIRADFYRQRHSIGMMLLLVCTVALGIWSTWSKTTIGISTGGPEYSHRLLEITNKTWTVKTGMQTGAVSATTLIYLYIAVFVIVIGCEYSQRTLKNTLTSGISRIQFILGKYVTILADILLLTLCYFISILVTGLALGRKPGATWAVLCRDTATMTVSVGFCISVIISLGIVLLVLTQSTVLPAVLIVVWPILIGLLVTNLDWKWLKYLDFVGFGEQIVIGTLKVDQAWIYTGVSLGVVLASIIGSALILSRKEI